MNPRKGDFEGILLVDKPQGITSHDVVNRLRRKLNMKKIGHAGTLDPMATGLLVMLIGKATKVSQYLISLDKTYEGTILLGVETDSQDADGEVVAENPDKAAYMFDVAGKSSGLKQKEQINIKMRTKMARLLEL